ncbi:phosphotransferase [Rhodococcus fascians]|nr:phosphotransferase [Rhodococcus fascians]MBY4140899.1 phosphotransferase [Rhodococcus fascians]MBY4219563.1 phosphotransferase [Rhodococcus fascians]MBY4221872.1 phosphotransferase [Rhodococcus fascians]MBY4233873.1 phosphotransferase [Rhodococcus fascians]
MKEDTVDRRIGLATDGIADEVGRRYGLDVAEVGRLGGEYDQAFALTTHDGRRAVVKVYRADEVGSVRWQHQLLDRLAGLVPVPEVLRESNGADVALVDADLCLGVYTWMDGSLLADLPEHRRDLLIDWGRTAGKIVVGLAGAHEDQQVVTTHGWDLLSAPLTINSVLPMIVDPWQREVALAAVEMFETVVAPHVAELPKSVVHHDLNDFNVFGDPVRGRITGVIDFADSLYTARVCEPAIAAAYAMLRKIDPIDTFLDVLSGFDQEVRLNDTEIALVYPLAMIRLVCNGTIWTARRGGPVDGYGTARSQHTWQALTLLQSVGLDQAETRLRATLNR